MQYFKFILRFPFLLETDVDLRDSADAMDERRKAQIAYEYLCHLEEAKL